MDIPFPAVLFAALSLKSKGKNQKAKIKRQKSKGKNQKAKILFISVSQTAVWETITQKDRV
jgi:hypothetical protein